MVHNLAINVIFVPYHPSYIICIHIVLNIFFHILNFHFFPVLGYPSYPTATPTVPQTQAAIATATAASFPRQPLAVTQGSVTVNGSIQGTAASIQLLRTALPNPHSPQSAYHGNLTTGLNGSYHKSFRSGYHKGIKRKADELDSADSTGDGDANPKPLYCKICRVTLNAPAQAKQHYEGKNHTRKIKVMTDGKSAENGTESSDQVGDISV